MIANYYAHLMAIGSRIKNVYFSQSKKVCDKKCICYHKFKMSIKNSLHRQSHLTKCFFLTSTMFYNIYAWYSQKYYDEHKTVYPKLFIWMCRNPNLAETQINLVEIFKKYGSTALMELGFFQVLGGVGHFSLLIIFFTISVCSNKNTF